MRPDAPPDRQSAQNHLQNQAKRRADFQQFAGSRHSGDLPWERKPDRSVVITVAVTTIRIAPVIVAQIMVAAIAVVATLSSRCAITRIAFVAVYRGNLMPSRFCAGSRLWTPFTIPRTDPVSAWVTFLARVAID